MIASLNIYQYFWLAVIFGMMVVIFALWKTKLCLPLRLLTVFMHEMGHAITAWVCCGKVTSITVQENESGLTNYTYRTPSTKYFVTPAGYLGSSIVGALLIICGATSLGSLIGSGVLCFILLVTIFFQKNWIPRILTVLVIIVVIVLWVLYFTGIDPKALALRLVCIFDGLMNSMYSVWDIIDDTVQRDAQGSDAVECATLLGCPNGGRVVGFVWCILSFACFAAAIAVFMVIYQPPA